MTISSIDFWGMNNKPHTQKELLCNSCECTETIKAMISQTDRIVCILIMN